MSSQSRFPSKDADFGNTANIVNNYLIANKARLVTTPVAVASLTELTVQITTVATGWNFIYPLSLNPATATTTIISAKNSMRAKIEMLIRTILSDIPKSLLTPTDRDTLNIPMPTTTKTMAVKPTAIPTVSICERSFLNVTINIADAAHQQILSKPDGVNSIEIEAATLPLTATDVSNFPRDTDFRHLATTGRSSYNITFTTDQLKATCYVRARYLNSRKEPGNWGQWISFVIA